MRALCVAVMLAIAPRGRAGGPTAPFVVIVNEANPITAMPKARVAQYFLKRLKKWDDGAPIDPVDLEEGSAIRAEFSRAVHGRSTSAIKAYWEEQVFSGAESPPVEFAAESDVVAFVRSHVHAIGYVSPGAVSSGAGVRVVDITGL
jgi:ABC-type phosphate transport system substrate-binding protein